MRTMSVRNYTVDKLENSLQMNFDKLRTNFAHEVLPNSFFFSKFLTSLTLRASSREPRVPL